jgi:tRNA A-37 threonylcarbamoyl transferase component Bud32
MLSRADANLIERDRQLTGLRTLIDTEAFCETLRQIAPGREIESAKARYVRYKPGTSCLVAYQVQVAGKPVGVYARCHAHDQLIKVSNARLQLEVNGPLGHGLLADPQAGIAVFVFPNDYEVKSLRKLFEGERTPRRLRRMLPAHPHLQHATPTILRYKPERRFVGKLEAEGGPAAVLRLYPPNQFADIRERSWAFKSNTDLHIPRVVGDSERYSALSHEWVDGQTLSDALEGEGIGVLERVAGALAALHRQRPRLGTMYSASDYCRGLTGAVDAVASLDDQLGNYANELSSAVQRLVMDRAWRPQAVHGDFTADQLVVRDDRVTILDFDRTGYGDPVMDVGAFAAGMISSALAGEMTMARALEISEAFAESYWRTAGFIDTAGAQACTAGALLMTAPEPFRHRVDDWSAATAALLESVDRVLGKEAIDA